MSKGQIGNKRISTPSPRSRETRQNGSRDRLKMIVRIEEAGIDDAQEILSLQRRAFLSEAAIYDDDAIPPLTQTLEEITSDFDRQLFLKAIVDEQIVGSARAYLEEETCFVGRLIVHPDYQKRGIGTRLMQEVENRFAGAKRFEVFTGHKSARNIRFYEQLGYKVFRTRPVSDSLKLVYLQKETVSPHPSCARRRPQLE